MSIPNNYSPLIDETSLNSLRNLLEGEFWIIRDNYIEQLNEGLIRLNKLIKVNHYGDAKKLVHRLRGSSLDMCCVGLASLFEEIESSCAEFERGRIKMVGSSYDGFDQLLESANTLWKSTMVKLLSH